MAGGLKAAAGASTGDFYSSRQMKRVHASHGPKAATGEIALYFRPEEISAHEPADHCLNFELFTTFR